MYIGSENGHDSVVSILLQAGADLRIGDEDGATPLHIASREGHHKCVSLLIPGPNINKQANNGVTALYLSCLEGHEKCTKILLEAGADASLVDNSGYDAIARAAEKGNMSCVSLLLQYGVEIRWEHDLSPLKLARKNRQTKIIELLQDYKGNPKKCKEPTIKKSTPEVKPHATPKALMSGLTPAADRAEHKFDFASTILTNLNLPGEKYERS